MDVHVPSFQDDSDIRPGDHPFLRGLELDKELCDPARVQQPSTANFYSDGSGGAVLTVVYQGQLVRIPRSKEDLIYMAARALDLVSGMNGR